MRIEIDVRLNQYQDGHGYSPNIQIHEHHGDRTESYRLNP